ncbi:putative ATP-dependent RNA helicase ddx4 [Homalodisca vitripennis]|nr:putative ATP-dependent RNA helicase ddx4 [Homalodisca vitripennis]
MVSVSGNNVPEPIRDFNSAGLRPFVLENIRKSGYTKPTPVQKNAIPIIMSGRDLMACAQTGSGKTAAFLIPIINTLLESPRDLVCEGETCEPQAIIVSPTRELTIQIFDEARKFSKGSILKVCISYGGTGTMHQASKLMNGCHILVATPGRLNDFVNRGRIAFGSVRFFVLDEADRMLDMGFLGDMEKMLNHASMVATKRKKKSNWTEPIYPKDRHAVCAYARQNSISRMSLCTDTFYKAEMTQRKDADVHVGGFSLDNGPDVIASPEPLYLDYDSDIIPATLQPCSRVIVPTSRIPQQAHVASKRIPSQLNFLVYDGERYCGVPLLFVRPLTVNMMGERQTLMFSATFPDEIQQLAGQFLHNYIFAAVGIVGGACADVEQIFYQVARNEKRNKLKELLLQDNDKVLVFVETKRNADFIAVYLSEQNIPTTSIHGDRMQREREIALSDFKYNRMRVLVATAVAARGLDIKGVAHVINYDLPKSIDEYVHRIGRTGRVGNRGKATSFFDSEADGPLASFLVKILQQANQEIPDWMDSASYGGGSSFSMGRNFGGTDFRKTDSFNNGPQPQSAEAEEEW